MSTTTADRRLLAVCWVAIAVPVAWAVTLIGDTIPPLAATPLVPGLLIGCIGTFLLLRTDARRLGWLLTLQTFFILHFVSSFVHQETGSTWSGIVEALGWNVLTLLSIAVILYPTGRAASRVLAVLVALTVATNLGTSLHWLGANVGWWEPITDPQELAVSLSTIPLFLSFFEQARIYRRRPRLEQQQLKWYVLGLATMPGYAIPGLLGWSEVEASFNVLNAVLTLPFPLAILFGITRYRLFEIDRIISRTVAYAVVLSTLAVLFVGGVTLLTTVLPTQDQFAIAASTIAVVALFNPLRRRVVDAVDRRFNRTRYVAQQVVEGFGRDVRDVTDLDEIGDRVHAVVGATLAPATVAVWQPPTGVRA